MDKVDNSDDLVPPELTVRYSDFALIGKGGMGRVIGAHDSRLDRAVAIKLLPRNSENALAVMRFQQEAKAVSKLNSPHVVQVLDFGYTEGGEPFLVMEQVKGQSLDSLLQKEARVPILVAINIAVQLCTGLEHAHANDVIHRDLKPSNVMLGSDDTVKILDFGLARILSIDETDWRLTRPGQPVGSILYMSPEQVRGEEADERSDVYSLGLVILKMVSGQLPFEGKTSMEIVKGRLESEPPAIPDLDESDELCGALEEVLQKALSPRIEDRYANMSEFKTALMSVPEDAEQMAAAAYAAAPAAPKKTSTKKKVLIAVALLALIAIAIPLTKFVAAKNAQEEADKLLAQLNAKRKAVKKEKFRFEPNQLTGTWYANKFVTDEDLELLKGEPVTNLVFDVTENGGNSHITHKGIEYLTALKPLRQLIIRETNIDDRSVPFLNKMKNLDYLDLFQTNVTDEGIMQLSPKLRLAYLDVKETGLTDKGLLHIIDSYPELRFLSIGGTGVTGNGIKLLPRLKKLKTLRASTLGITDEDLIALTNCSLTDLDLSSNPITDKGIPTLKKLTTLASLILTSCHSITPAGMNDLRATMTWARISPATNPTRAPTVFNKLVTE